MQRKVITFDVTTDIFHALNRICHILAQLSKNDDKLYVRKFSKNGATFQIDQFIWVNASVTF